MASVSSSIDHVWEYKMPVDITAGTENYPSVKETADKMWIICFSACVSFSLWPLKTKGFPSSSIQLLSRRPETDLAEKAEGLDDFSEKNFNIKIMTSEYFSILFFSGQRWAEKQRLIYHNCVHKRAGNH